MKRIIITGGSDGLGKEFAKLCIAEGIEIVSLSRHKPDYPCVHILTDLADDKAIASAATIIKEKYAEFDALVNCAGLISIQRPNEITYEELEATMKVNSLAPIFLTSQLFDLIKKNEADVINVGSTVGLKAGALSQQAYTTSKWAIRGTSASFEQELAKTKSRVMQFNVGGMNTKFWNKYNGSVIENPDEWMKPEDVAAVMLYALKLPKQLEISDIAITRKKA
ncbi:MAG: SDR family NAD(P)-dependent oxidoreductase [Lactobacillus sp.]|jgi:short-subunit dehydrogenase|nr:SDR family NAD(P)-dependent oxidoreductase [Lactobacillus sp.]